MPFSTLIDMSGKTIGRMLVIDRAENTRKGKVCWRCVCKCGTETIVTGSDLRTGNTRSCGCLKDERTAERSLIHGQGRRKKRTKIYTRWKNLRHIQRTELPFLEFLQQQSTKEETQCLQIQ